ncbi:serine carboxypeptidase S28-domain-containing protein [Ganoderma leucocontextum]|nr:serine carboxypeptidase S28-domain-containing protein [Ganoderma leucocontextum]
MVILNLVAPLVLLLSYAEALPSRAQGPALVPPVPFIPRIKIAVEGVQLIDHTNPSLGTFKQRYYHTYEFYEPGGPIILLTPGEVDASGKHPEAAVITMTIHVPRSGFDFHRSRPCISPTSYAAYLTNATINGQIAQTLNGSTVVLEHRFFGASNPYNDLSVESFQVHTVQQAVDDLVYFAQNVQLPMPGGDQLAPGKAPWVLVGGSYAGALTSFTMTSHPGVFTAGYASSAVVQAIVDFWGYFEPIRQNMPANCSADVEAVIAHVDSVLGSNDTDAINALKATFGLPLGHDDDFAAALQQNLYTWQLLQPDSGTRQLFYHFCDALEVQNGVSAPASGWGLDHALQAWGTYWKSTFYGLVCGMDDVETCLGTYNASSAFWTDTHTNNWVRSWLWLVCTEFGFQFTGAPEGQPSITSRVVTPEWGLRQCTYRFPEAFGSAAFASPNATGINSAYGGWNTTVEHVVFASGMRDPWKEATVAAEGSTNPGSDLQPHLLSDGFHCSDLVVRQGVASASVKSVQDTAVSYIAKWVSEWEPTA